MRILTVAFMALALSTGLALAHDYTVGTLVIDHPWSRAMPPGAEIGGGFMTIVNSGGEADRLVSVSSPRATRGEVHETTMHDGVMRMRELEGGLEIAPGATVELKPGGYHVMFMGVSEGFTEGERVPAVLHFEKAGEVPVEFAVGPVGTGAPAHTH